MAKVHPEQALETLLGPDHRKLLQSGIKTLLHDAGLELMKLLLQAEVTELAGPRGEKNSKRNAVRWGSEVGSVTVRGTKESIARPRVRSVDGSKEFALDVYKQLADGSWLTEPMLAAFFNGVSTRSYARLIEKQIRKKGVSRSSVSRRTIAATKPQMDEFLKRDLRNFDVAAIFVDGIHYANRQMIVAIGVSKGGRKRVLGLRLGATENIVVARDLIADLIERGLDAEKSYLFVVDGAKALTSAITAAFGSRALIQRCQEHKIRNVLSYLPRNQHGQFRAKLMAAFHSSSFKQAAQRLEKVRRELLQISDGAANSLTEGMLETLTILRMGVRGALYKSLRTTNIIESAFSAARRLTSRTTRFRNEQQIYRWSAQGLMCAERNFRILPGYRQFANFEQKLTAMSNAPLTF